MICFFSHLFASANTSSSATAPDWPSLVIRNRLGQKHSPLIFTETPTVQLQWLVLESVQKLPQNMLLCGLHVRDFSLKLSSTSPHSVCNCGCQSCLPAIRHHHKHSKLHHKRHTRWSDTNANMVSYTNKRHTRGPAILIRWDPCCSILSGLETGPVGLWCEVIRTPVRRSNT